MAVAYFDCFAGSGGDMIVAALLDAGADIEAIGRHIARLNMEGLELSAQVVRRNGLRGMHFSVQEHGRPAESHGGSDEHAHQHRHSHRGLADVLSLIGAAALPDRAAERACAIFRRLAAAEAKVHGIAAGEVHFHEVGAVDKIGRAHV